MSSELQTATPKPQTGICCSHCGKDPGPDPRNPSLWNGFLDKDNMERVCWSCQDGHYLQKFMKTYNLAEEDLQFPVTISTTYSEFPLMIKQTEL
jgi:hypothetical protein